MNYIDSHLQADERVLDRTTMHWITLFDLPLLWVLGGPCMFAYLYQTDPNAAQHWYGIIIGPAIMTIVAAYVLVIFAITYLTTEIAITNRRIIYKSGLISRRTLEMNVDKVESVDVNQSFLGSILDYGTILVRGVGTGLEPLNTIVAPLEFRDTILSHTVSPSASPPVPPSPTVPQSRFTSGNPITPEGRVFGHRHPIME